MSDQIYMNMAIALARQGSGFVSPNPLVGAVIVKDDIIIGQGYHKHVGGLHAERNALASCTVPPQGATLYVTLEPCCHYGKTPPCTDAIIASGITRVVVGTTDPNPKVAGNGIAILRRHNIQVDTGVLEPECRALIKVFTKFITTGRPYVLMKYAMTMDGKIATHTGQSQWITGEAARLQVQQTRHAYSAIMAGVDTVICDNPLLTCRLEHGRNPIRIICDTHLRTPLESRIVATAGSVTTIIATCCPDEPKKKQYEERDCIVLEVKEKNGHVDLDDLITVLGKRNIDSILLEGGGTLNWSALEQQIVDGLQVYIAPKIFGGIAATPVGGAGIALPDDAIKLKHCSVSQIGSDYLIESEVSYSCLPD